MEIENSKAFAELGNSIHAALETYSNVHRGSGHFSVVTTELFDKAREIVLEHLSLDKKKYVVIFCTPRREYLLKKQLKEGSYKGISSEQTGLPLAVRALAVKRRTLPAGIPFQSGGGTTRIVSRDWAVWAQAPGRFEAGTPAVINVVAFARALLMIKKYGNEIFRAANTEKTSAEEIIYHDDLEDFTGQELLQRLRDSIIGRNVIVPTAAGQLPYVNLDNAASTSSLEPVWKAYFKTIQLPPESRNEIAGEVKSVCSKVLNAPLDKYDVIFTTNTTEGINYVADAVAKIANGESEPVVLNTVMEHNSNDLPWRTVRNGSLVRLAVDDEGFIDTGQLESILAEYNKEGKNGSKRIKLVAVSGASNVLGSFNDLPEISRITHKYGAELLVDASQLVAHRKVDVEKAGIDYFVFCAHKVYAPFGTGVVLARKGGLNFNQDELQLIKASGEENAGGIAALGKALVLLNRLGMENIRDEERLLTREALAGLSGIPGLTIYGVRDSLSPRFEQKGGVIAFYMKGKMPNNIARELAEQGGIGIRYGCHCAHLLVKRLLKVPPSLESFQKVLARLFPGLVFPGLARISLGMGSSSEDLERLIRVLRQMASRNLKTGEEKSGSVKTAAISHKDLNRLLNEFKSGAVRRVYYQ